MKMKRLDYRKNDILPTLQAMAILEYMHERSQKGIGHGISIRHLDIVSRRIGIYGHKRQTYAKIAEDFGFSKCRASQIYDKARKTILYHCRRKNQCPYEMNILLREGESFELPS
jgi:DNA-directed RNA polymerase sigma subunit (sigma70/sigma32)